MNFFMIFLICLMIWFLLWCLINIRKSSTSSSYIRISWKINRNKYIVPTKKITKMSGFSRTFESTFAVFVGLLQTRFQDVCKTPDKVQGLLWKRIPMIIYDCWIPSRKKRAKNLLLGNRYHLQNKNMKFWSLSFKRLSSGRKMRRHMVSF